MSVSRVCVDGVCRPIKTWSNVLGDDDGRVAHKDKMWLIFVNKLHLRK